MAASSYDVYIYPYPLINLSVVNSFSQTYNIIDMGSYYSVEVDETDEITVSADGYQSQTKTIIAQTTITLLPEVFEMSKLSNGTNTYTIRDDEARSILTTKQDTISSSNKLSASLISGLATVATSGSYNDLSNKPTIPTVNNATLTIQKNGTTVNTFTANASNNVTANIEVPNIVSSVSASSTNNDGVGAKLFYDTVGDIETSLHTINSGGSTVTVSIYAVGSTISNATVTIGDETFTNFVAGTTYTFEADKNESYTLRLQRSGRAVAIKDSNDNALVGYPNTYSDDVSYTFTATSDVTYRVYSGSEKV